MMVNLTRPLDWTTGSPGIWLNIMLRVSVRVFLEENNV